MQTEIAKASADSLARAREIILNHGAVAFHTETVYGLGANAFDDGAVRKIGRASCRERV